MGGDLQCWNPLAVQVIYCQLARYSTLFRLILDISSLKYIFAYTFPLISSLGAFLIFLQVNGSIVLGDKDAHTAVFNPAQLLYFSLFTCIFALPCFIANLFDVLKFFYQNIFKFLVLTGKNRSWRSIFDDRCSHFISDYLELRRRASIQSGRQSPRLLLRLALSS